MARLFETDRNGNRNSRLARPILVRLDLCALPVGGICTLGATIRGLFAL